MISIAKAAENNMLWCEWHPQSCSPANQNQLSTCTLLCYWSVSN